MVSDTNITSMSAYRVQRAYTEGRNRAFELSRSDRTQLDLCGADALNPYAAEPERSRWNEGFAKADLP